MARGKKKTLKKITYGDLEMLLQKEKKLEVEVSIADLNKALQRYDLLEILKAVKGPLELNEINDLLKQCTGKDRENLQNLSLEEIELLINKLVEKKDYAFALTFAKAYLGIVKYFR